MQKLQSKPLQLPAPENGERKERSCALDGRQNRLPTAVQKREAFGPSRRNVREGQRIQITSLGLYTAMGHQIRFEKSGLRLLPILERADQDLVFQQGSRSCGGDAARTRFSLRTEEVIGGGCAHGA